MEKSDSKEYREIFSEKNLYFVLDLFKELDLKEEVGRVDSQMIKLKM